MKGQLNSKVLQRKQIIRLKRKSTECWKKRKHFAFPSIRMKNMRKATNAYHYSGCSGRRGGSIGGENLGVGYGQRRMPSKRRRQYNAVLIRKKSSVPIYLKSRGKNCRQRKQRIRGPSKNVSLLQYKPKENCSVSECSTRIFPSSPESCRGIASFLQWLKSEQWNASISDGHNENDFDDACKKISSLLSDNVAQMVIMHKERTTQFLSLRRVINFEPDEGELENDGAIPCDMVSSDKLAVVKRQVMTDECGAWGEKNPSCLAVPAESNGPDEMVCHDSSFPWMMDKADRFLVSIHSTSVFSQTRMSEEAHSSNTPVAGFGPGHHVSHAITAVHNDCSLHTPQTANVEEILDVSRLSLDSQEPSRMNVKISEYPLASRKDSLTEEKGKEEKLTCARDSISDHLQPDITDGGATGVRITSRSVPLCDDNIMMKPPQLCAMAEALPEETETETLLPKSEFPSALRHCTAPEGPGESGEEKCLLAHLEEEVTKFFDEKKLCQKADEEIDFCVFRELDEVISAVTSEWRTPVGEHLRDLVVSPVGRVQLYRGAGLLKYLSLRFHTYTDFPACQQASPVRLAQSGFYYTGTDDTVQCYLCEQQHSRWTVMDIPDLLHFYLSPLCTARASGGASSTESDSQKLFSLVSPETGVSLLLYLQKWKQKLTDSNVQANSAMRAIREGQRNVGQNLAALGPPAASRPASASQTLPQLSQTPQFQENLTSIPVAVGSRGQELGDNLGSQQGASGSTRQFSRPHAYKNYATYQQRIASFRNWPAERSQRPEQLSLAGFFYAGSGDCVRCYHCGLGLKHWDDEDDPWLEHVRWRSSCDHLIVTQGPEYVAQAFRDIVQRDREQEEIAQRFNLDDQPQNPPRPPISNNFRDVNATHSEQPSYQTAPVTQAATVSAAREAEPAPDPRAATTESLPLQGSSDVPEPKAESPPLSRERDNMEGAAVGTQDEGFAEAGGNDDLSPSELARIEELRRQNQALRQQNVCRQCKREEVCMLFLPCQHLTMCEACSKPVRKCPTCKKTIKKKVRTFLS